MKIKFTTDNAAFEENREEECARILRAIADKLTSGQFMDSNIVRDINGNTIGTWSIA